MKVKVMSVNRTQQMNVINKAKEFGAVVRDGDTGPVAGKLAVVIDTGKTSRGAILLSRNDFFPAKKQYDLVLSYGNFMSLISAPWVTHSPVGVRTATAFPQAPQAPQVVTKTIVVEVPVAVGVCAQSTLKVSACDMLVQEAIGFKTLGLPFLMDNGVNATESEGVFYILDTVKNTATVLNAAMASAKAKTAILNDECNVWAEYAREFDLMTNVTLTKVTEDDAEGEDA